jgi:hypothetical protein
MEGVPPANNLIIMPSVVFKSNFVKKNHLFGYNSVVNNYYFSQE